MAGRTKNAGRRICANVGKLNLIVSHDIGDLGNFIFVEPVAWDR